MSHQAYLSSLPNPKRRFDIFIDCIFTALHASLYFLNLFYLSQENNFHGEDSMSKAYKQFRLAFE
ncbi:CLUMA_CG021534, isoform A [Clunio marinus]|uniref:CLUMA_CG021534, isoform A n=1 Tax=Clunio marinus TaxID=568069 RepID=A0A1J1J7V6_9DIPT|nr:CLUMA_CG021534, isoform A [Clunio marinus]